MSEDNYLKKMQGLTIIGVYFIHDYVQMIFDNEGVLTIFSPVSVFDRHGNDVIDFRCLIYRNIKNVNFENSKLELLLDDDSRVHVRRDDDDDSSPEALTYHHSGDSPTCVVHKM